MDTSNEHEDLRKLAPTLASVPKGDPFVTPEAFFDQFPHQVQAAIVAQRRPVRAAWYRRWALALPVVALLGVGAWWLTRGPELPPVVAAVEVTPLADDELAYLGDIDAESIAAEAGADLGTVDLDLKDEEVMAYLEHEHADLTELIIEE